MQLGEQMKSSIRTGWSALGVALVSVSISAYADPYKNESGHGRSNKARHEYKEEFWDGNCKVKRKYKKNGDYKEERKCKATPQVVMVQPPWIIVYGGGPAYRPGWEPVRQSPAASSSSSVSYCNSDTVGSLLGGIAGAVVGNQIGKGSGRTAALIGGAIAGTLIGGEIGRRMDAQDQACIGQALEFAPAGQQFSWQDPNRSDVQYAVVPGEAQQNGTTWCRPYTATVAVNGVQQRTNQNACRQPDGTWVASH
jgi:surface antigen